jgi:SAM-dependent methyltransferase
VDREMSKQQGPPAPHRDGREADPPYMLPRHHAEPDRLDVQHYALLEMLGTNFLAPIDRPARVLDVGSGSGQWAYDMCRQFPDSFVVGLDVVPGKPGGPPNHGFVRANVLRGLPFVDGGFEYVHQRLMATSSIPLPAWGDLVTDLVRVTAPRGWVELVEVVVDVEPAGPATRRLIDMTRAVGRSFGVDMDAVVIRVLGEHLRRAGLGDVEQRIVGLPVGEWGGRAGSLTASNLRALFTRLADPFEAQMGLCRTELGELLAQMHEECQELHSKGNFVFAVGRKSA